MIAKAFRLAVENMGLEGDLKDMALEVASDLESKFSVPEQGQAHFTPGETQALLDTVQAMLDMVQEMIQRVSLARCMKGCVQNRC